MNTTFPPLTAYRVTLSDGHSYETDMAHGTTLAEARDYFLGSVQYADDAETIRRTVIDVQPAEPDQP